MKHFRSRFAALLLLPVVAIAASIILASAPALAAECAGIQTSVIDCGSTKDTTGSAVVSILVLGIQVLTALIGVVAIGAFVYAGILYSSASGDAGAVTKAKDIIRNTVIGLVAFALMAVALNYFIPGGLFTGSAKFGAGGNGLGAPTGSPLPSNPSSGNGSGSGSGSGSGGGSGGGNSTIAGACYNVKTSKSDIATKNRFHVSGSQPYALENSLEGIEYAKKKGYDSIDIDVMVTKDGVLVGSHAWEPLKSGKTGGFTDTAGKIKDKDRRISGMTLTEVRRLKHKDGYRISTLEELMVHAKKNGINLIIEMKVPEKIEKQLPQVAAQLNKYGVKAGITSRKDKSGYQDALKTARSLGFNTRMASSPGASAKDRTWVSPTRTSSLCK